MSRVCRAATWQGGPTVALSPRSPAAPALPSGEGGDVFPAARGREACLPPDREGSTHPVGRVLRSCLFSALAPKGRGRGRALRGVPAPSTFAQRPYGSPVTPGLSFPTVQNRRQRCLFMIVGIEEGLPERADRQGL